MRTPDGYNYIDNGSQTQKQILVGLIKAQKNNRKILQAFALPSEDKKLLLRKKRKKHGQ